MKTRLLIIIIVTVVSISLFVGMWIAQNERNIQDQKFMEKWRHERELLLDEIAQEKRDKENNKTNSTWTFGEDYCGNWCDQEELYEMGCDQSILAHITKHSNLLDEEFNGKYAIEYEGLPDGVSKEKFDECVDFIYHERSSFIISRLHTLSPSEREDFITKFTNIIYNGEFHDHAYITDLQNEYTVDEPITFTVVTWGYGHPCQSPSFTFYYETKDPTNIVFEDKFIRWCQVLEESDYTNYYQELGSSQTDKAQNQNIYPIFYKPGEYLVSVDDKAEYSFSIKEPESSYEITSFLCLGDYDPVENRCTKRIGDKFKLEGNDALDICAALRLPCPLNPTFSGKMLDENNVLVTISGTERMYATLNQTHICVSSDEMKTSECDERK